MLNDCIRQLGAKPHARLLQRLSDSYAVEIHSEPMHAIRRGSAPVSVQGPAQNSQKNRANGWPDAPGRAGLWAGLLAEL